jgi:ATP-dependent helicase/nuclease subunit B
MAVRFILGRAGSGKTHWCLTHIRRQLAENPLGTGICFIVPRQATFQTQRQLACADGGFFGVRILSFDELARELLIECHGAAMPQITDRGRRMILGSILRKNADKLSFFRSVAHQPGMAAELDHTFAEMERCGLDAAEIAQTFTSEPSAPRTTALASKVRDLALLYAEYRKFVGQQRLDPSRRLSETITCIEQCSRLSGVHVFVDSYFDFTGFERRMLAALGNACPSLSITLTLDPASPIVSNHHHRLDDLSVFHRTEEAYQRLQYEFGAEEVQVDPPVLLDHPRRFTSASIASLKHALVLNSPSDQSTSTRREAIPSLLPLVSARWAKTTKPSVPTSASDRRAPDESLRLLEAPDRRAEVDAVARWIATLTAAGLRYRDIAILMRSEEDYRDHLDPSFSEHGIPFFMDRRRGSSHHPLLRLIRASLSAATTGYAHDAMMGVLKTSLVGLTPEQTDELENYVLLHGIHHSVWVSAQPWTGRRQVLDDETDEAASPIDPSSIDSLRHRVIDRLAPFVNDVTQQETMPVRAMAATVFKLLESFNCRQTLVTWMQEAEAQGRLEERDEHEQVWSELSDLFDELVDLFADDQPLSLTDFTGILDAAVEGFDVALTPPAVDQVLVGSVDRTRTPDIKACAVLGLNEGQFPQVWREGTVFSDADRRSLAQRKINLDPDTSRRLLDEMFLGYVAFTRASERLLLTRATLDPKAHRLDPSPLWDRVRECFPDIEITTAPREEQLSLDQISTPRQLVCALMRWVRSGAADPQWQPLYQWLAAHPACDDAADIARFRSWKSLLHRNTAELDAFQAGAMFPTPLRVTLRQLETYRRCPYQHFASYSLNLQERRARDVDGSDLSQIYHDVLDRIVRDLIRDKQHWPDFHGEEAQRRISALTAQLGRKLRDELMVSTGRNRYLLDHVERTLKLIAGNQKAVSDRGNFRPAFTDVRFGIERTAAPSTVSLPPLRVTSPAGREVLVRGKIDRIDLLPDGSACAIDYRLGHGPLHYPSIFHGSSLQLLAYLLVLQQHGGHLKADGKLSPSAAFSVAMLRKVQKADNPLEAPSPDETEFHLQQKPRGIFDLRVLPHLDKEFTEGHSSVVQAFIKKDGSLGHTERSDAASAEDLNALMDHVAKRIGEMADEIVSGRIEIRPQRIGKVTPCPECAYRSLCRFEPSPGCYDDLPGMSRQEVLERISSKE